MAVEAEGESSKDLALADAVADGEAGRYFTSKLDIGELVDIHIDYESEEDGTELQKHLPKQDGELTNIKSFAFVHGASKHVGAISEEIPNCLHDCPGAHVSRHTRLVGELEVMKP